MSFPNPDNYARDCDCGTAGANTTPPPASLVAEAEAQNLLSSNAADVTTSKLGNIFARYDSSYTEDEVAIAGIAGNTRGLGAVDLQQTRVSATQVAAGELSVISGGISNTCNAPYSTVGGGSTNNNSAQYSVISGGANNNIAENANSGGTISGGISNTISSGIYSTISGGDQNTVSAIGATVIGGWGAVADRFGMVANASFYFTSPGDSQAVSFVLKQRTLTNVPTNLYLGHPYQDNLLTIPSGKILSCTVNISGIKSDGSQGAHYIRKVMIKNVGGTTALVGTVSTVGTDVEDNAAWDVTITADNTNDALDIKVTGAASTTIRWVAVVQGLEIAYGL